MDYHFVRPALNEFLYEKLQTVEGSLEFPLELQGMALTDEVEFQALLKTLGIDIWGFGDRFIKAWEDLTPNQLERVIAIWNAYYQDKKKLHLEVKPIRVHEALRWTVAQMIDLFPELDLVPEVWDGNVQIRPSQRIIGGKDEDLREVDERICKDDDLIARLCLGQDYLMPFKQCLYCGRLDTDKRGKRFRANAKLCHVKECCSSAPNPQDHGEGCCYGAWRGLKKSILAKLKYHRANECILLKVFTTFCDQLYEANLKIAYPLRAMQEKPENFKFIYER